MIHVLKKIFEPTIAAWLGAIAPVCALVSIGISIALSPWFSWTNNALSDLGVSEVAPIFNSGLMLTGILMLVFAVALARAERESRLGLATAIGLLFGGISVVGVGVFTEAFLGMHILFAMSCFISLILSSVLLGIRFVLKQGNRVLVVLSLSAGILSIVVLFAVLSSLSMLPIPILMDIRLPGMAILEALIALPFLPWYIALCIRLYRKSSAATKNT